MLTGWQERLDFTKGLGFRLAPLLSIAVLPLGMISLVQTLHMLREAERTTEIALLGRTASAAAGERALLQGALGAADALGPAVLEAQDNPAACAEIMRNFVQRSATFVSASFVPMDGRARCVSGQVGPEGVDLTPTHTYQEFIRDPGTLATAIDQGRVSGRSLVAVAQPLYRESDLIGYIAVGLSRELLYSTHALSVGTEGARILTFSNRGDVLTVDRPFDRDVSGILPRGLDLTDLLDRTESTFRDITSTGEERVFTVVTVIPGLVYALGSWSPQTAGIAGLKLSRLTAVIVPIALWAVSLLVSYFAVYRLVLRHIRELRGQMRRFAIGNRDTPPPVLTDAPAEITDVSQTFHNMARILIRDEAAMEEAVAEKTVLLKEVHHRVKNNLQLIASIINMQSRMIEDEDAKRVLRSVQDRVAALATIYRNLYQAEHLDAVDADRLIGDIMNQMVNISITPGTALKVETSFQPVILLPDQAVPLSLLATEAITNALKYAGVPPGEDSATVRVSLSMQERDRAMFEVVNTTGQQIVPSEGTGLGSQLIEAFATQLDGEAEVGSEGHSFYLRLLFRVQTQNVQDVGDLRNVVLTSNPRLGSQH